MNRLAGRLLLVAALALAGARGVALAGPGVPPASAPQRVDANRATEAQLQTVKGIGPAIAARILEARRDGPFHDLADLESRVKGVGPANVRRFAEAGLVVGSPAPGTARVTTGGLAGGEPAARGAGPAASTGAAPAPAASVASVTPLGRGQIREWPAGAQAQPGVRP